MILMKISKVIMNRNNRAKDHSSIFLSLSLSFPLSLYLCFSFCPSLFLSPQPLATAIFIFYAYSAVELNTIFVCVLSLSLFSFTFHPRLCRSLGSSNLCSCPLIQHKSRKRAASLLHFLMTCFVT